MAKKFDLVLVVLGCALGVRLAAMAWLPLTDTTEARYGEIARLMLETGDWMMPQFDYGVPFWAKPALAFWLEAGAFGLLGVNELAGRLPSVVATLGTMACLYRFASLFWSPRVGLWTAVIFFTSTVAYVNSGAILTDPFLVFGTTLSMVSLAVALRSPRSPWRYLFFIGLVIGLLAKGPLALVLVAGPVGAWVAVKNQWTAVWRAVPWGRGLLLTAVLALPWYILAERHSPGFLDYFIIGEHWKRFTEAGWQGDLYGSAHRRVPGTIWLYWLGASFPWGLLALWRLAPGVRTAAGRRALVAAAGQPQTAYLLSWALFPMIFFTVAGNILWTYILPAMPPLAVLLAAAMARAPAALDRSRRQVVALAGLAPVLMAGFVAYTYADPDVLNSEKGLVRYYDDHRQGSAPLIYVQDRPFSARFYSRGQAKITTLEDLRADWAATPTRPEFVAVPNHLRAGVEADFPGLPVIRFTNRRFTLYGLTAATGVGSTQ